ncbi:family 20 glycosylhydrolase [Actinotalea ferrariae]|uniref:family 20 glycosylhydrolase n=1 Tax=Actinotalea ferrariae TaxID=1386098 RepID=UPI001C8B13BD|nr:family 20 glycosylhydrolase [Actinotalea ferrariae]MBX9246898.1 family 20 glycosylhydrolase [Actinotalea ferrariae]
MAQGTEGTSDARSAAHAQPPTATDAVTPIPAHVEPRAGDPLVLGSGARVVTSTDPQAVAIAVLVAGRMERASDRSIAVVHEDDGSPGAVVLRLADAAAVGLPPGTDAGLAQEAYRLEVTDRSVVLTAVAGAGLLNAARTLQQLAEPGEAPGTWLVARQLVVDVPRFAWRGLCLDVARHFFGVDVLRRVVDVMASLKLNVLHLHLTDDQGWRIDVPSRPELADVSGKTAVGDDPGGFYTAQDWTQLLAYAESRHITVVPEIDLPGHVNAALHAVGELTPGGRPARAYTGIDVGFSRLHADLPATRPFLRDVLGDVAAMTPGPWVHIGGDEVLTMEPAEYRTLVRAAVEELAAAGKTVVGWQEIASALDGAEGDGPGRAALEEALAGAIVQYWDEREGAEEVTRAADQGARVILSPATRVYLDMRYDAATPVGLDWAGHVEVRDSYDWEPLEVLPGVPADRVLGVEAALWTETVRTAEDLFLLLLPRLAAVAEVAWSPAARRDWEAFRRRLPRQTRRWTEEGYTWYPSPQVPWSH